MGQKNEEVRRFYPHYTWMYSFRGKNESKTNVDLGVENQKGPYLGMWKQGWNGVMSEPLITQINGLHRWGLLVMRPPMHSHS